MSSMARIALVCEGDAESSDKAFSGTAKSMLDHLRMAGHEVTAVNARPPAMLRAVGAGCTYSRNRKVWRTRYRHGGVSAGIRSLWARKAFQPVSGKTDVVLQIGPGFTPPGSAASIPYTLYCDWNMALSIRDRDNPHSSVHHLAPGEAEKIDRQHRGIYRKAACIFTISECLRKSFIEDYGLDPDKVVTAYPGPNFDHSSPARREDRWQDKVTGHAPTILFIGKEFARKGGEDVLQAFRAVRSEIPDARLLIAGPRELPIREPGVEILGFLRKDVPEEKERLLQAYRESDVFCLPSLHDPFPTVVREAMFFGLPCVTTDIWAFPEMVIDGQTGYTVRTSDPERLAERLIRILLNPVLARQMGIAGRERMERLFTWAATARKMQERLEFIRVSHE